MGLRRSEINGLKYSDVDYINRTLKVERQLGRKHNTSKEDFAPKTFTKQEVGLKTGSSYRDLPIPDIVFEAVLEERQKYEKIEAGGLMIKPIRFLMEIIFAVLLTADLEARDFIRSIIKKYLLKIICRM